MSSFYPVQESAPSIYLYSVIVSSDPFRDLERAQATDARFSFLEEEVLSTLHVRRTSKFEMAESLSGVGLQISNDLARLALRIVQRSASPGSVDKPLRALK